MPRPINHETLSLDELIYYRPDLAFASDLLAREEENLSLPQWGLLVALLYVFPSSASSGELSSQRNISQSTFNRLLSELKTNLSSDKIVILNLFSQYAVFFVDHLLPEQYLFFIEPDFRTSIDRLFQGNNQILNQIEMLQFFLFCFHPVKRSTKLDAPGRKLLALLNTGPKSLHELKEFGFENGTQVGAALRQLDQAINKYTETCRKWSRVQAVKSNPGARNNWQYNLTRG